MATTDETEEADGRLRRALLLLADHERAAGAPMFMGKPDRWYQSPNWRCRNGHVTTRYLSSDAAGRPRSSCLAGGCGAAVYLTFPEDVDGPLPQAGYEDAAGDEVRLK